MSLLPSTRCFYVRPQLSGEVIAIAVAGHMVEGDFALRGAPPVFAFATGTGRCGSSLVQELLSRHPDIGFISNVDDRFPVLRGGRHNGEIYRHVPESLTRKGRLRYAPSEGYRVLAREVSPLVVAPGRSLWEPDASPWLRDRCRTHFEDRAVRQGKPVFLHKFTGWPRAGFIAAAFPEARFINIVRDGRAVANSLVQMSWWQDHRDAAALRSLTAMDLEAWEGSGNSFAVLAGLFWKAVVEEHERARQVIAPGQWIDVRYEDILARPGPELGRLLGFVGLRPNRAFKQGVARHHLRAGRGDAFRRELDPSDVACLDTLLGETLQRYGYASSC